MNLKELRERASYGQTELAKLLGISRTAIFRWEDGERSPSPARIRKLAALYGVSVQEVKEAVESTCLAREKEARIDANSDANGV
jgi:transcriptional regulator with XRE-family HTH domain